MTTNNNLYENWIKALRSGNYKNGKYKLKTTIKESTNFCCLGVLCDISKLGRWETPLHHDLPNNSIGIYNTNAQELTDDIYDDDGDSILPDRTFSSVNLPEPVQKTIKLRTNLGQFNLEELPIELQHTIKSNMDLDRDDLQTHGMSLSAINDYYKEPNTFEVIAQVLEARPPSLFIEN